MYSKGQNEFVKGFVVCLLLLVPSGLVIVVLAAAAPPSFFAAIPNWILRLSIGAWAFFCAFAPLKLKNQKWVQRWLWNKE